MKVYKFLFILLIVIVLSSCSFAPPQLELPEDITSMTELEPYLEKAVAKKSPPGLTLAVIKGNEIRYLKSFGLADAPRNMPVTEKSVYQWWSITKLFTATAILQLMEQGKLDLDDPVVKHLPFMHFRGKLKNNNDITIRHLLSHSSGLDDIGMSILGWIHYDDDPHLNQTELLKNKLGKYNKIKVTPGSEGRYTNFGYLVLAAIIESVSKQRYEDYIREKILTPLDMDSTDFVYTTIMRENEATGSHPRDFVSYLIPIYIDMDRAVRETIDNIFWFNRVYSDQKGSTGLIGSTEDLIKFVKVFLNQGKHSDIQILSPPSIALMQRPLVKITESPSPSSEKMEFGLGWFISNKGKTITFSHGGAGMGFVAMLQIQQPQNQAVITIANSTYLGRNMGFNLVEQVGGLDW